MTDETEVCWNCKHYDKAKCYCATTIRQLADALDKEREEAGE